MSVDIDRSGLSARTRDVLRLFDFFDLFEARQTSEQWKYEDLHLWPIAKYLSLTTLYASIGNRRGLTRSLVKAELYYSLARLWRGRSSAESAAARFPATDGSRSLFTGNATTLTDIGGLRVQLNYDYLRLALEAHGQKSQSVLAGISDGELREAPSLLAHKSLAEAVSHARARPSALPIFDDQPAIGELLGFVADLCRIRRKRGLLAYLNLQASRALDIAAAWGLRFARNRPPAVYCYNYGSPFGWGLALACRRMSIPCYDIQHGVQGRMQGLYHWTRVPAGGWSCVPRGRLVWSPTELRFMDASCVPHVIGPGSLQTIAAVVNSRNSEELNRVRSRLAKDVEPLWAVFAATGKPSVLFSAQHPADVEILARLTADEAYHYFFRFHPRQLRLATDRTQLLADAMTEACTRLPLPVVMAGVDALVTHYSSTFLEGRYFGIPCVAINDYVRTLQYSYGDADLVESSVERCAVDLSALNLQPNPHPPAERLERMIGGLPNVDEVAEKLLAQLLP